MIIVRQGLGRKPYSCILQPFPGGAVKKGDQVKCIDPRNNHTVMGECIDHWTFLWTELPESFCQEAYGLDALTLYKTLIARPEFKEKEYVRFCKIKPIE